MKDTLNENDNENGKIIERFLTHTFNNNNKKIEIKVVFLDISNKIDDNHQEMNENVNVHFHLRQEASPSKREMNFESKKKTHF